MNASGHLGRPCKWKGSMEKPLRNGNIFKDHEKEKLSGKVREIKGTQRGLV